MAKITEIKPTMPKLPTRKRVAAYARVSMETERLHHSLSAQVSYYSSLIQSNPEWIYAGVYADEGISGTSTEKRAEFQRMLADCEAGRIDIILTKSISRFARNTVDLLNTVRHLRELGIEVRFEKENINSLSGDGEVMLTLLASFAQSESESISNNVKWGVRKRMQQGIPNGHFRIYGYRWEGDDLVIVPEEAAIVKRIFQNFLDGKSRLETEREFAAEGITTREGCRWVDSNIKVVLTNVTYTGNLLLQKEFIEDPIGKHRKKNHGELPQYYVENTHEAIIDKETFDYVQSEIARRKELGPLANKSLDTCCFTGKIKCPHCGLSYMHEHRTDRGTYQEFWVCGTRKMLARKKSGRPACPNKGSINQKGLIKACNEVLGLDEFDEQAFLDKVDHIEVPEGYVLDFFMKDGSVIRKPCPNTGHKDCWTKEYREKVSRKRKNTPRCKNASAFTGRIKCAECGNNYRRQTRKRSTGDVYHLYACATTNTCHNNCIHEDTLKVICAKVLGLPEFDAAVFTENIEKITVAPGGHLTFTFKDGHEVQEDYDTTIKKPRWSAERRARFEAAPKREYSSERRKQMSERMKKIRSEKYWNSKGR